MGMWGRGGIRGWLGRGSARGRSDGRGDGVGRERREWGVEGCEGSAFWRFDGDDTTHRSECMSEDDFVAKDARTQASKQGSVHIYSFALYGVFTIVIVRNQSYSK
jgi:hypothetical protein